MSVHGQMIGHLVRRGVSVAHEQLQLSEARPDVLEDMGSPVMDFDPREYWPLAIVAMVAMLAIASVRYTLGEVVASLAMIESPSSTAIIESAPPRYADEPDAPLEKKEPMMPAEAAADQDIEITVINHKPITASISTSIRHLHSVGGFFGRWRGAGVGVVYHMLHAIATNALTGLIGFGFVGHALMHILVSLGLARVHMVWTHTMIAAPTSKSWFRRMVPRKECKVILLPTLAFAVAQQVTVIMPIAVAFALGLPEQMHNQEFDFMKRDLSGGEAAYYAFALLAIPLTAVFVALAILIPASVTLTRVEAALLPEDQETIVPFDRSLVFGEHDHQTRGGRRSIFVQAWKSFEPAARLRLIKLYAKMFSIQITIGMVALTSMILLV
ncbi:hypothetical protein Q7P37_005945 [Cladosporium fusiforme]